MIGRAGRHALPWAALALVGLLTGCATPPAAVPTAAPVAVTAAANLQVPEPPSGAMRPVDRMDPSRPVGLDVPAIGVRATPLTDLGVDAGGALEVPPDAATAGWFTLGPAPGATGPAVIAAHIDYGGLPGVFARLDELVPGDEVGIHRADGTEAVFTAYRVERYDRSAFPTDDIYGDTPDAELRLITCGGVFDRGAGRHPDNVVVYARLAGARGPAASR